MLDDTPEGFERQMELLRRDPRAYIAMIDRELAETPNDSNLYFDRHQGWDSLGDLHRALEDINRAIAIEDDSISRACQGRLLMRLGRYREALAMLARGEAMDTPEQWAGMWGPHYQATCHAHLGEEAEAMAACDKLETTIGCPVFTGRPAATRPRFAPNCDAAPAPPSRRAGRCRRPRVAAAPTVRTERQSSNWKATFGSASTCWTIRQRALSDRWSCGGAIRARTSP